LKTHLPLIGVAGRTARHAAMSYFCFLW
jgi:hypothetical protein